nr:MAG TPA: hypothetical protein [Caudoviricetes sp.]
MILNVLLLYYQRNCKLNLFIHSYPSIQLS